ncbi:MAG: hypothetical protein ACRC5V_02950, partial [Aeromonas sp.]
MISRINAQRIMIGREPYGTHPLARQIGRIRANEMNITGVVKGESKFLPDNAELGLFFDPAASLVVVQSANFGGMKPDCTFD